MGKFIELKKNTEGYSLLEMLMTLAVFSIILIIISNLIVVNLFVARRVDARTKVREETSYLLKNIKKDIRNSENMSLVPSGRISIEVIPPDGVSEYRCWIFNSASGVVSRETACAPDCSSCADGMDYRTPGDIEVNSFDLELEDYGRNKLLIIKVEARADGMPDGQNVKKIVGIATRNYE